MFESADFSCVKIEGAAQNTRNADATIILTRLRFPSMLRASLGYSGETSWIKQNSPFLNACWPVIYTRALIYGSSRRLPAALDLAEPAADFDGVRIKFNHALQNCQRL